VIAQDAVMLRNQPVAREGVLKYTDGRKLKKWEDLRRNIGRVVPVIDEHPAKNNGKDGLVSGREKRWGYGLIKSCPRGEKQLCADLVLLDGAPIKAGYSIGYPYLHVEEAGTHDDGEYDSVQSGLVVDHIALTDGPRDHKGLMVAPDSEEPKRFSPGADSLFDSGGVYISHIGYDSFVVQPDAGSAGLDARDAASIIAMLRKDNPTAGDEELLPRALIMLQNADRLIASSNKRGSDTLPKDKETGEKPVDEQDEPEDKDKDSLIAEVSRLRAEKTTRDSMEGRLQSLESEARLARDSAEKYRSLYEREMSGIIQTKVDSLLNDHGFDSTEFDGKHAEFINGALYAAQRVARSQGIPRTVAKDTKRAQPSRTKSINDYIYNFDSKRMELHSEEED